LKLFFDFLVVFCGASDRPDTEQQTGEKAGPETNQCFGTKSGETEMGGRTADTGWGLWPPR